MQSQHEPRRPQRHDTFDLRDDLAPEDHASRRQHDQGQYASDEDHSVLEDDSSNEDRDGEYMDDDGGSSSLSIPNESIDFDLVYSLHTFVATVEGQANVVKGDSLFLMDDSNSYWWLVRVLTTQEVGYIPAENIETPFERLARLNKHRNIDLASATQDEMLEDVRRSRRDQRARVAGSPTIQRLGSSKSVVFRGTSTYRYPPAVWGDPADGEEWDEDEYGSYEEGEEIEGPGDDLMEDMEPDDGMSWEDGAAEQAQAQARLANAAPSGLSSIPGALRPGQPPAQSQSQPQQATTEPLQTPQQLQSQLGLGLASNIRQQASRDRVAATEPQAAANSPRSFDPDQITETKKLTATPSIARDGAKPQIQPQAQQGGPLLPSAIMQQENAKRAREELESAEEQLRKKGKVKQSEPQQQQPQQQPQQVQQKPSASKLKKERDLEEEKEKKEKKKSSNVFSGLFGRKKDKEKEKEKGKEKRSGTNSLDSDSYTTRNSEDSGKSGSQYTASPPEAASTNGSAPASSYTPQQSQQQLGVSSSPRDRNSNSPRRPGGPAAGPQNVSQHTLRLQQEDQQQQALYQQYLARNPGSGPDATQPSYGLQSAAAVMTSSSSPAMRIGTAPHPRPGSLILTPTHDGPALPDLSVMRVFAGANLQSEATFKTVLLNSSTTSAELVRQAMQRFRLAAGEDEADYYLTVKQLEGSSTILEPTEKPLVLFEELAEAAQMELEVPRIKRSSVGSISSLASNLSMHPAIKKLSMNDFTDDSAVKFYLNRRGPDGKEDTSRDGDDTLVQVEEEENRQDNPRVHLTVDTLRSQHVTPERFTSPTARFPLQVVIYPEDLPDGMVFDPYTEAIVPKATLRDRPQSSTVASPGISQTQRRKVFVFPKNTTVAEVIELGLERFGIVEGVVDGGDDVEDKLVKRRSFARVRYGLTVEYDGQERELTPSSKVLDAFVRPPAFRLVERRSADMRRRSADAALLLGSADDVQPDDPVFVLRRAAGYRSSVSSRSRLSAPLDEVALQHQHQRESVSVSVSVSESSNAVTPPPSDAPSKPAAQPQGLSRQEIIAAQRAASRANQRAILTAQSNSEQGVDILLPDRGTIRSTRGAAEEKVRYSYIDADGETYDISEIIEEEWEGSPQDRKAVAEQKRPKGDLLEGALTHSRDAFGETLNRVISKIKDGKGASPARASPQQPISEAAASLRSASPSVYSVDQAPTPTTAVGSTRAQSPADRTVRGASSSRSNTPVAASQPSPSHHQHQPSIASIMSDISSYETANASTPATTTTANTTPRTVGAPSLAPLPRRGPLLVKDDFGVSKMMAIIELGAASKKPPPPPPLSPVDALFFGPSFSVNELHPRVKDLFEGTFKQLDEMDKQLDQLLQTSIRGF